MQKVSKAYKESMKSSLRERAYIMISFGLVNQEAQAKATVDNGSYAYYSNKDNIFGEHIVSRLTSVRTTRSISILSEVPGRPLNLEGIQNQSGVPRKYWKIQPISSWCSTR